MRKKVFMSSFSLFVLLLSLSTIVQVGDVKAQSKTIVVPTDYSTIQGAINAAGDGDTVFVKRGIYNETLVLNKTISLIGEDREDTIIDAQRSRSEVIAVEGDYITVSNFTLGNTAIHTLTGGGDYLRTGEGDGIVVYGPSHFVQIVNNSIVNCPLIGIYLYGSTIPIGLENVAHQNILVINNTIYSCYSAIQVDTVDCFVPSNSYYNCTYGVKFEVDSFIVGIAGGPSNGTVVVLAERNVVEGNQEINVTSVPAPFPSLLPTSSPTPTLPTSPSPSVAEFPNWMFLPLLAVAAVMIVYLRRRKQ